MTLSPAKQAARKLAALQASQAETAALGATVSGKQARLVSGTNIKTINGASILGPGNINTAPTSIAWSIVTGTPTTLEGYGVASFETVAANLDASGAAFSYSSGDLSQITYANGVVKSFAYGPDGLSTVTLSGALPSGINLIKSLSYTSGDLTAISYS